VLITNLTDDSQFGARFWTLTSFPERMNDPSEKLIATSAREVHASSADDFPDSPLRYLKLFINYEYNLTYN
jgi:hypothetical protein